MGAETQSYTIKCFPHEISDNIMSDINEQASERGTAHYSGSLGQKYHPREFNQSFSSYDEFYEHFSENNIADKWDEYVWYAEIQTVSKDMETATLKRLNSQIETIKQKLDAFETTILKEIKGRTSKTKSCKKCGKVHTIAEMNSLRCQKCRCIMLTDTQMKQKKILQDKQKELNSKIKSEMAKINKKKTSTNKKYNAVYKEFTKINTEYQNFDKSVLAQVKSQKSKTKSCKCCRSRFEVKNLSLRESFYSEEKSFDCPNCRSSMLSPTQKKQKTSLKTKLDKKRQELNRVAPTVLYGIYAELSS